ncbi:MAG: FkbM family methyltransferase [Candidatus Acidiferrales bacterium]
MTPQRIIRHLGMLRNARRFRVPFIRNALFHVPKAIKINGVMRRLEFPDELGVKNDFLGCFIGDVYGLRQLGFTPKTILDIGANVGFFSVAARSYFPNATIHAYEPNQRIIPALANQASVANFQYFPEAVGSESGSVEILESGDSNQAQTKRSEQGSAKQASLKQAIARMGGFVDLAKIDCEGAEWDLFQASDCWKNISHLRMEYHLGTTHSFDEVAGNIDRLGFKIIRHVPSDGFGLVWAAKAI